MNAPTDDADTVERGPDKSLDSGETEIFSARELSHVSYHSYRGGFHDGAVHTLAAVSLGIILGCVVYKLWPGKL